ncbi:jg24153, partial [Pararge aegeria aegeria]
MINTAVINDLDTNVSASTSTYVNEPQLCIRYLGDIRHQITVLSQNIRSVRKNLDYLTVFIQKLNFLPDLIILTECWLLDGNTAFNLTNYEQRNSTQYLNKSDGIVIYFRQGLKINISEPSFLDANCLIVELEKAVTVICIYRSPSFKNIDNFLTSLEQLLKNIKGESCFIVGDINIDIKNDTNDTKSDEYLNLTAQYGFIPGHQLPTRGLNCLDHVLVKSRTTTSVVVCRSDISDHDSVIFSINNNKQITLPRPIHLKKVNYVQVTKDLQLTDWSKLYEKTNANKATDEFINIINTIVSKNTELRTIRHSQCILKPWMTASLIRCAEKRDRLHMSVRKNPNDQTLLIDYKKYRNTCNNILQNLKDEYDRKRLLENKDDLRKKWDVLKDICHLNSKNNKKCNKLITENTPQPTHVLNEANNYFSTIGEKLARTILDEVGKTEAELAKNISAQSVKNNSQYSFFFTPTDELEILKIISNLKTRSAAGIDTITNELLKTCKLVLASPITFICNLSLSSGVVPDTFKIANVCPIPKDGDPTDVSNYRPISLLSCISKIVERVVNKRLLDYLESRNLLSENQYGFRAIRSTEDAVTELTNFVSAKLDQGNRCIGVFLDLAKAFDTLSRKILIKKLEALGIRGTPLQWFQSYLTGRKQKVTVDNLSSKIAEVNFGVPQGSVLGPTLFLVYINDLCSLNVRQAKFFTFADDTAVVFYGNSWGSAERLCQQGLQEVFAWLRNNLLTVNTSKTKIICFKISSRTD